MGHLSRYLVVAALLPAAAWFFDATLTEQWVAPRLLFWIVLVAASLCVLCAAGLAVLAHRSDHAELGFVASFYFSTSALPLVHGLTVPSVLYGPNEATVTAGFLAVPVGLGFLTPSLLRSTAAGRWVGVRWRGWMVLAFASITALGILLLARPQLDLAPTPGSGTAVAIVSVGFVATVIAGRRHVWLAEVADRPGPLVIAYGYLLLGASGLMFIGDEPWTFYFWLGHGLDITGVFLATVGGILVYRRRGRLQHVIRPVTAVDPHAALELSLSPVVHRFMSDLEAKDRVTRDHVVRTASLAVEVAVELGLDPATVRRCGTAALLHDIGKIEVPDEILTKPDRLTDDEFAVMQGHAAAGARLLSGAPAVIDVAPAVRAHHERVDGTGYPDRLAGTNIPIEARVVSACDAHDAMSFTRHYRQGMPEDRVRSILTEHAGSQWDAEVVVALLRVVDDRPDSHGRHLLDRVGRDGSGHGAGPDDDHEVGVEARGRATEFGCDCVPADAVSG